MNILDAESFDAVLSTALVWNCSFYFLRHTARLNGHHINNKKKEKKRN